jgi:hypothetical protein
MCMAMSSSSAVGSDSDNGNDGEGSAEEQFEKSLEQIRSAIRASQALEPSKQPRRARRES